MSAELYIDICLNFNLDYHILSQICTYHHSSVVVACAKLWTDVISTLNEKISFFSRFWLWTRKLFVMWVPEFWLFSGMFCWLTAYWICRKQALETVSQTLCGLINQIPLNWEFLLHHYNDVIMRAIASQITSLTIVYSIIYSDADQRKHQISASLAFVQGIHRGPVNSPHKWPVSRKMFPFDDVIMVKKNYSSSPWFFTCHDNRAAVTCANLWTDWMIYQIQSKIYEL